jgi:hypothetical protein
MSENKRLAYSALPFNAELQRRPSRQTSRITNRMATAQSITTDDYKLFPSPRNLHRLIFEHEVFVPYPYMLIDMESYYLKGKFSLFAACRLKDNKMGQLVTLELPEDEVKFKLKFVPD